MKLKIKKKNNTMLNLFKKKKKDSYLQTFIKFDDGRFLRILEE